jgi:hypothetical protein
MKQQKKLIDTSRFNPFRDKSSARPMSTGIPKGVKLVFYNQTRQGQQKAAEGIWNVEENQWDFSGEDDSLVDWLKTSFAQPLIGRSMSSNPNMTIKQDTMAYVYHMRDIVLPRKKVIMKIEGA